MIRMVKRKRVTLYLYEGQLEFLDELQRRLRNTLDRSGCIRFCINLANVMLNFSPYTASMGGILAKALEETYAEKKRHIKT
ncbi:hypothetical protein J7L97_05890 [Candidatus Bathyarchaeota archaeon]|nr:hypothetical protein [Candidatus Bathyarchaeota archaeon]